jgi:hypothetical protein
MASDKTWEEFWPYYVGEHAKKATRTMHFIGTTGAIACVATALVRQNPTWLLGSLVCGYGFAWVSHFAIEKNKPATFKYPAKSLAADFVMWWKTLNGTMDAEVARYCRGIAEEAAGISSAG